MTAAQPGNPASTGERAALRDAIAKRDAAKEKVLVATESAERGRLLVATAQRKLANFGDVDDAILKHRAASFKSAAQGGPKPSLALPAELVKRERARDEAASELQAARAAHNSLVGEFAEAQALLRGAETKVSELAAQVLIAENADRGRSLMALWDQLWATVDSLNALAYVGRLPVEVVHDLRKFDAFDHRQWAGGRNTQRTQATVHWKAYRDALTKSADATASEAIGGRDRPTPAAERAA